jgi:murein DD-endopeptidase MepM/ murein hydrolase activator NlpD
MAKIEIDIPRPWLILAAIVAIIWFVNDRAAMRAQLAAQVAEQETTTEPDVETERPAKRFYTQRQEEPAQEDSSSSARKFYYADPEELPPERVFYTQDESDRAFYTDDRMTETGDDDHSADAEGGPDEDWSAKHAEDSASSARERQAVLSRKAEILRYELHLLEDESTSDPMAAADLRVRRQELLDLLADERAAEDELLASLKQMWEARGFALALTSERRSSRTRLAQLLWPIEPLLGISAHFDDDGYAERFGFEHGAIDIPAPQGSTVFAPADGIVAKVTDNGYGFSSVTLEHDDGLATLYGHVSAFLVAEGQRVNAGEPIAISGGQPGTKGAGRLTTGAHLHFEVYLDGKKVDPLEYLAKDERAH